MSLQQILTTKIQEAVQSLFDTTIERVEFQATRRDFEGDITFVIFPLVKVIKGNPIEIGNKIGEYLVENTSEVVRFNVVSGFLNIVISDKYYLDFFNQIKNNENFGSVAQGENAAMVEYASPNTNKPLHLGHVRNVLLGYSVAQILKASGKKVYKTQVINDRGIHICKSMLAWKKFGNGETPESTGLKGDKLVGNYYVAFDKEYKNQINELVAQGKSEDEAKKQAPIMLEAQQMLLDWEAGKPEVMDLWNMMNSWVYEGFDVTYKNIGVDF
ncbi:MAG: arginine--tRNA ligase, partial [Flavobacteriaceae bacterium]